MTLHLPMPEATLSPDAKIAPARPPLPETRVVGYIVLGLIVAIVCTYALVVRADFINFDDNSHVFENPLVKGGLSWHGIMTAVTKSQASLWIPLTWISFMADVSVFGMNPGAMHAVNLAWHVAATVLLFLTVRRMTGRLWASAFVAGLFGLHPLNVESVAWIAERKSVLCTFFWFATIAAYARYAEKPRALPFLAALACAALALLSKPMAVTVPCTLLLLDFWSLARWRSVSWLRLLIEKAPFFLLSIGSSLVAMHSRRVDAVVTMQTLPLASRVSNALVSYAAYLGKLALPINLGVFYPHPIHPQPLLATLAALLLLAITGAAVATWRTRPYLLAGWLWFLGVLVPVIGLVQVGSQARADRFCYVPEIGIFLAVTWLVADLWSKNACALRFVAGPVLFACVLLSSWQVMYWQDGVTLFEHTIAVTKNNACALANAGLARAQMGDTATAITHFQASLRIEPDQASTWREFGVALEKVGKPQDGMQAWRTALHYDPTDLQARYRLALALANSGGTDEAISQFQQVLGEVPHSARAHYYLARALDVKGRRDEALTHLRTAVQLAPDHPAIATTLSQLESGPVAASAFPEF